MDISKEILELKALVGNLQVEVITLRAENAVFQAENVALRAENVALHAENVALRAENVQLKRRVKELEEQLKQNSGNSSRPPSTDMIKPAIERKKGGKRGGKEGHKGNTLKMVEIPDKMVLHRVHSCKHCGEDLSETAPFYESKDTRQVYDIVLMPMEVTGHRIGHVHCEKCGESNYGTFPSYVPEQVQYGPGIKSIVTYLNNVCSVPVQKISQLTEDMMSHRINEATILKMQEDCSSLLEPILEHIREKILASEVVHFDETGARAAADTKWVHTASTSDYTWMFPHELRGHEATDSEDSIVKDFRGKGVTDFLPLYVKYKYEHCYCNAHLLRDLKAIIEQGAAWAVGMRDLLLKAKEDAENSGGCVNDIAEREEEYDKIVAVGRKEEAAFFEKKGHYSHTKAIPLLNRLEKYQKGILAFARDVNVPFTNNLAERDIRPLKTKIKVSTSFRSFKGLKIYTDIRSFISTINKQSLPLVEYLKSVFESGFVLANLK